MKRRFEGEGSFSSSSLNTNNNTKWNNKNTNGIEERQILGEDELYACTSDGGQGSSGKKPPQNTEFSDTISNSGTGTGTGTNPTMARSAFVNPSIVIETSPTDSLPLSPGAYNNGVISNGCHIPCSKACSGLNHQKDGGYCCGDIHDGMVFQFPCVDNNCQGHCDLHNDDHHRHFDDQDPVTVNSPYEQLQCQKQAYPSDHCEDRHRHHHHQHRHHPHRHLQQQDEMYRHACPQQLPKSVLDIPSATARWVQNMPLAMRSFHDLTGGPGGFGAFRFGGLHQSTLGPMRPVYKPCSCPMVCPPSPQHPLQLLEPNVWNNSMPALPDALSERLNGGAPFLEDSLDCMNLLRRRNENASDVMEMVNAKRKKMRRRRERKAREDSGTMGRRRASSRDSREHNFIKNGGYPSQGRRHTMCVAEPDIDQNRQSSGNTHAKSSVRTKAPPNLTISIPDISNSSNKNITNSINVDGSSNNPRRSPVPLPVTPTVTIQNSCGPSYHHRRHTSIASVSSSSSDLMVLPVPLPVACSQPLTPPPRLPPPQLLSSPNPVPSSPSRLSSSPSRRKTSTPNRIPSPHLLHPTCDGAAKGKGKPRSPSPIRSRSCCSTPCMKEPSEAVAAALSPLPHHGSRGNQLVGGACSPSSNQKEGENTFAQSNCSFKLTRLRTSSSSSSKQSSSEICRHLPRSGSGLSGESRPRGCPIRRVQCSPSEGHLASIASQAASPAPERHDLCSLPGGMYRNRRCLSDLHCNRNADFSPSSPVGFDSASYSLSPTSSLPSSRHRFSLLQQQRSISAAEMLTTSSRPGRDDGGASPTWSNPSTRTSQGGGASSYSHSPSPHLLQVPDNPAMLRPVTPDNSMNIYNNNGNYSFGGQPNYRCRQQQQHLSTSGASNTAGHTQMRHSVLSDSNLAYYKSQLYLDDGSEDPDKKLETDPTFRRNSTFTHSTGKINLTHCGGPGSGAGECDSNTTILRPSSSCGSTSSYGSSLHPHHQPPLHHYTCCQRQQLHEQGNPSNPSPNLQVISCGSSQEQHNRRHNNQHYHSTGLLSPTDNQNVRLSSDRLSASSHNINSPNLNSSQQNLNASLSSRVMETKL